MWLLDQWAERHILDAQRNGEFDSLCGSGKPLELDDDSYIPMELRAAWRLLKIPVAYLRSFNSGRMQLSLIICSDR